MIERVLNKYDYLNEEQKQVAEVYNDGGARVIGMSLSAVASKNLGREANIESGTIANWMHQRRLFEEAREKFLSFNEILSEGMLKQQNYAEKTKSEFLEK